MQKTSEARGEKVAGEGYLRQAESQNDDTSDSVQFGSKS